MADVITVTFAFRVTGRVHGVGFRCFARATAERLGVHGWVANEADGSVTGAVSGDDGAVADFLGALAHGPPASSVERVVQSELTGAEAFSGFAIRR